MLVKSRQMMYHFVEKRFIIRCLVLLHSSDRKQSHLVTQYALQLIFLFASVTLLLEFVLIHLVSGLNMNISWGMVSRGL